MIDRWGTALDEQKPHAYSAHAAPVVAITRAGFYLADVWTTLWPKDSGHTHGEPGARRRLDGWECLTGKLRREVGVVYIQVIDAIRLSVPWSDKKKGLKVSDHDAATIHGEAAARRGTDKGWRPGNPRSAEVHRSECRAAREPAWERPAEV